MVEALVFWALALYGALMIVWQSVNRIKRRVEKQHPVKVILVVQNAENYIEGVLRTLLFTTSFGWRDHEVFVMDIGSTDDTERIVQTLAERADGLRYTRLSGETDFYQELERACWDFDSVRCIYDLRVNGMAHDVTADMLSLCQ